MKKLLKGREWHCLIVLDACRYDLFEKVYNDFFGGELTKSVSPASDTQEWCDRVLANGDFKDVVYVSGNAHINSTTDVKGFYGPDHLYEVIDAWKWGWDSKLNTTSPWNVTEGAKRAIRNYPGRRIVVHYMQPHFPYIDEHEPSGNESNILKSLMESSMYRTLRFHFAKNFPVFWNEFRSFVKKRLGMDDEHPLEKIRQMDRKTLLKRYETSLRITLKSISDLVQRTGATFITSDHGELLGEDDLYGHGHNHPLSRLVPWFEVKKIHEDGNSAKERIKKRIKEIKRDKNL